MSKTKIVNPISKGQFKTFLSQFIQIHYFQPKEQEATELENVKNLLFPPDYPNQEYTELINFIAKILDSLIISSFPLNKIKEDLNENYDFDEEIIEMIETSGKIQRTDIVSHMNQKFNSNAKELVKLNWATKMILAGNTEDYYNGRFVDLEFAYASDDSKRNILHKTISLTKEDIGVVLNEFQTIKDNLNRISELN